MDALGESYFQSRQADESGLGAFQEQFSEVRPSVVPRTHREATFFERIRVTFSTAHEVQRVASTRHIYVCSRERYYSKKPNFHSFFCCLSLFRRLFRGWGSTYQIDSRMRRSPDSSVQTLGEIHVMGYDLDNIQHEDQSLSPLLVMKNGTKISCVGYNPLKSEQLASTDYDGACH